MRHDYLKELQNLRELIINKEQKGKKFEYMEVRFFEPTEILSQDMCFILNTKLGEMKDMFEKHLESMQIVNH